jgi:hypothetical protein
LTKWQVDPYGFGVRHVDRVALRHGDRVDRTALELRTPK